MHRLHRVLAVVFAAFVFSVPVFAQETPAATPVLAPTNAPVVVNVEPATNPLPYAPEPSTWQIITALGVLALTVFEVGKLVARRAPVGELDTVVVNRLQQAQDNRELMDRLERAYQAASRQQQTALETLGATLRFIAPMTAIKADDKLAEVVADIQQQGPPATPPYVPTLPPDSSQAGNSSLQG